MNNTIIKAERRELSSRGEVKKMRREGKVPGVIYGIGMDKPTSITVDVKEIQALLKSNPHAVLEIEVPGIGKNNVLLTEVQRDSLSRELLHIDFHKINMNESIKTLVRLEFSGQPAGEKEGGMLQIVLHELEVECLPKDLPESITVEVEGLQVGENLTIADLKLPDSVKTAVDPEAVVVAVLAPQKEAAEDEEVPASGDEASDTKAQPVE
jgi:large subunit ribosomal protein L25